MMQLMAGTTFASQHNKSRRITSGYFRYSPAWTDFTVACSPATSVAAPTAGRSVPLGHHVGQWSGPFSSACSQSASQQTDADWFLSWSAEVFALADPAIRQTRGYDRM